MNSTGGRAKWSNPLLWASLATICLGGLLIAHVHALGTEIFLVFSAGAALSFAPVTAYAMFGLVSVLKAAYGDVTGLFSENRREVMDR